MRRARRATTFVVAIAVAAVATACGSSSTRATTTDASGKRVLVTTTTRPRRVNWPLTGLPTTDAAATSRPALTVKVDNVSAAHPQIGVDLADVVYEEVVECDYTRLAAVFQSHVPPVVGPVRSVRRTDQELVHILRGIFAYSGGAPYAITSINTAPVVRLDETRAGDGMFRDGSRGQIAPHNLFGRGPQLYAHAPSAQGPPSALFRYSPSNATTSAAGVAASHVVVGFRQGYAVTWDWDPVARMWKRGLFGRPDVVVGGAQIAVRDVVVESVAYSVGQGACNSVGSQAELHGSGTAWLLRDGRAIQGTWAYRSADQTVHLLDAAGNDLRLAPGAAWVELPKPTYSVTIQ